MCAAEFELNWFGSWVLLVGGSWMVLLVCFRGKIEVGLGPLIPVPLEFLHWIIIV